MRKHITRILVGLAIMGAAGAANLKAFQIRDYGFEPYRIPYKDEVSRTDRHVRDYFGRPMEEAETDPVFLESMRKAKLISGIAVPCFYGGCFVLALGTLGIVGPPILRAMAWLFIPDFLRRFHEHAPDAADPRPHLPAGEVAGETEVAAENTGLPDGREANVVERG